MKCPLFSCWQFPPLAFALLASLHLNSDFSGLQTYFLSTQRLPLEVSGPQKTKCILESTHDLFPPHRSSSKSFLFFAAIYPFFSSLQKSKIEIILSFFTSSILIFQNWFILFPSQFPCFYQQKSYCSQSPLSLPNTQSCLI